MNKNLIFKIFSLKRFSKILIIFVLDFFIVLLSSYLSLSIRLDELNLFNIRDSKYLISIEYFLIPLLVYFVFVIIFKFYNSSFRYYNLGKDFYFAFPIFAILIILLNISFNRFFSYGALIINITLIFLLIILSRKLISKIYFYFQDQLKDNSIIVCSSKNLHKIYEYLKLNHNIIIKDIILLDKHKIDFDKYGNYKINNIKNINKICFKYKIKKVFADEFSKKFKNKEFKNIQLNILQTEDLFKYPQTDIKEEFVDKYFESSKKIKSKKLNNYKNKSVLITGAGGSIGKNIFYELTSLKPKKLILVEQDELKLFNLKKEYENSYIKNSYDTKIVFKLGNLSEELFIRGIFLDEKNIDVIIHTAAYKHVGFGQENILSFVKNNIFVTHNLAKLSIKNKVSKFIFISTDKAVNPKSIMGYSKSICEKVLIFLNEKHNLNNIFKIVRFGNVINSDGSVLPIFEKQILHGGPVTVTHKDVNRYFMSIKNASQLVLNTIKINKKIGIFILEMGKPHKILDIANSMISFFQQKKLINEKPKIIFIGLQEGEKINEELVLGKNLIKTNLRNILYASEKMKVDQDYDKVILRFKNLYKSNSKSKLYAYLKYYA